MSFESNKATNVKAIFSLRKYIDCEGFDFDCFGAIYIFLIISRFLRRFNDMFGLLYAAVDLLPTAMAYKQFPIKDKKLILILDKRPILLHHRI